MIPEDTTDSVQQAIDTYQQGFDKGRKAGMEELDRAYKKVIVNYNKALRDREAMTQALISQINRLTPEPLGENTVTFGRVLALEALTFAFNQEFLEEIMVGRREDQKFFEQVMTPPFPLTYSPGQIIYAMIYLSMVAAEILGEMAFDMDQAREVLSSVLESVDEHVITLDDFEIDPDVVEEVDDDWQFVVSKDDST